MRAQKSVHKIQSSYICWVANLNRELGKLEISLRDPPSLFVEYYELL